MREQIPQTQVLDWLLANHPALHKTAEIDRSWIWLVVDLRGDENKATREAIKGYGFIFSRRGGHPLPSGHLGMWGHSCQKPLPFKKGGRKKPSTDKQPSTPTSRIDPFAVSHEHETVSVPDDMAEASAFFNT